MRFRYSLTPLSLIFSLLVHFFIVLGIAHELKYSLPVDLQEHAIVAELVEMPSKQRAPQQIAPPTQAPETKEPPPDAKLGERNTKTEKESIQRGENGGKQTAPAPEVRPKHQTPPSPPAPQTPPTPPAPPQKQQKSSQPDQRTANQKTVLRLGDNDLLAKLGPGILDPSGQKDGEEAREGKSQAASDKPSDKQRAARFLSVEPFRRSTSSSMLRPGVSDLLNNVPDGEITLLNEKADQFAVFVRRVALQVFGTLRSSSWTTLPPGDIANISRYVRVRAVISPKGKFVRSEMLDGSGSFLFDDLLKAAVERGANDQNPPLEAVTTDGNFHFVFLARTWSRRSANNVSEQRWIVLGTGLE